MAAELEFLAAIGRLDRHAVEAPGLGAGDLHDEDVVIVVMGRKALVGGPVLAGLGRQIDVGLDVAGEDLLERAAELAEVEHRIVEVGQDDGRAAKIMLGDPDRADPAAAVDIGLAGDAVLLVGKVDHALLEVGAGDEMIEHVEGQQVGVALGFMALGDQRLALVIALEERLAGDRRDQEAERVLVPARRGALRPDRPKLRLAHRRPTHAILPKAGLYRGPAAAGSRYFGSSA